MRADNRRRTAAPRTARTPAAPVRAALAIVLTAGFVASAAGGDSLVLHWTAPGDDGGVGRASSYELRYSTSPVGSDTTSWWTGASSAGALPAPLTAGTRESFTVNGLAPATTYYFVIRTADEVPNWSGYSNVSVRQTGTPPGGLPAPTGFSAVATQGGAALRWDLFAGASGLRLYRGAPGDPNPPLLTMLAATDTAWSDTTTVGGASYEYELAAFDATGEGSRASALISIPADRLLADAGLHGYPNPAKGQVTLRFRAGTKDGASGRTRVTVFDLTGRRVCALLDALIPAGEHAVSWNCRSDKGNLVAPGLYNVILDGPAGRSVTRVAIVP